MQQRYEIMNRGHQQAIFRILEKNGADEPEKCEVVAVVPKGKAAALVEALEAATDGVDAHE